jgi:predicted RNA-binding protein with TRAM domain
MLKSFRVLVAAAVLIMAVSLFILLLSTTATYTAQPQVSQVTGTPLYMPMVRKDATPTPTTPPPTPDVRITDIRFDGDGIFPVQKEYVVIVNQGGAGQSITDWTLSDRSGNTFTLPRDPDDPNSDFILRAGATVNVRSAIGENGATDLYWGRTTWPVWDRAGDTAYLRDNTGRLVSTYSY